MGTHLNCIHLISNVPQAGEALRRDRWNYYHSSPGTSSDDGGSAYRYAVSALDGEIGHLISCSPHLPLSLPYEACTQLGAHSTLRLGGEILPCPRSMEEAREIFTAMRGRRLSWGTVYAMIPPTWGDRPEFRQWKNEGAIILRYVEDEEIERMSTIQSTWEFPGGLDFMRLASSWVSWMEGSPTGLSGCCVPTLMREIGSLSESAAFRVGKPWL